MQMRAIDRLNQIILCAFLLSASVAWGQLDGVTGVLISESLQGDSSQVPSIATDALDQPHIVIARDPWLLIYDRIGGNWIEGSFDLAPLGSRILHNPNIEIADDKAWISGLTFSSGQGPWSIHGMGVCVRDRISTAPTAGATGYSVHNIGGGVWDSGTVSVNPDAPYEAVVTTGAGIWKSYVYAAGSAGSKRQHQQGQLYAGLGGEKNAFYIGRGPAVQHPQTGLHRVWHGAIGGYAKMDSSYQSSLRQEQGKYPVAWAAYSQYPGMGDDGAYCEVIADNIEPLRAYLSWSYNTRAGVLVNIYDPRSESMLFSTRALLVVDPIGDSGRRRFAPQMAPAKDGGVWISWTSRSGVYVRYISQTGQMGNEYRVGDGERANICIDSKGYLHVVYSSYVTGTLQYVKLAVTGVEGRVVGPADFDGDGKHDLTVFEPDGWWTVRFSTTGDKDAIKWGVNGDIPVPANYYSEDARDEFAVWRPSNGTWYINTPTGTARIVWGERGQTPIAADFDGDGRADVATFSDGQWNVKYSGGGSISLLFGREGDIPFAWSLPGDNDGKADFIVYRPSDQYWRALYSRAGAGTMIPQKWGIAGDRPYPGDYDGDGIIDFGIYRPTGSRWRALLSGGGDLDVTWGTLGDLAAPGNYETADNKWDVAVYRPQTGRFFVKRSSTGRYLGEPPVQWGGRFSVPVPGNYVTAGEVDIVFFDTASGWWQTSKRDGSWDSDKFGIAGDQPVPADYNGDGRMNRAVFRPSTGWWYIQTAAAVRKEKWGLPGDQPVPADYDNDGIIDLAVFRPSIGSWYINGSQGVTIRQKWGVPGDLPVPADYDNDGQIDLAVYRPSTGYWHIQGTTGVNLRQKWGVPALDRPLPADYDNDGQIDLAVYRESTGEWLYRSTANANAMRRVIWGGTGTAPDTPILADIDGDGILDLTIYEYGNWWIRRSDAGNTAMPDPRMGIYLGANGLPLGNRAN